MPETTTGVGGSRVWAVGDIYANVDAVSGASGPLFTAAITISGTPVKALVDPGSSATIMSFDLFKKVGKAAGIPRDALKLPEVTLRDYSRRPIPIFAVVELEFEWQGNKMSAPVYLKSEQGSGMVSEPCLLGTNVVIPLELMIPWARGDCQGAGGWSESLGWFG